MFCALNIHVPNAYQSPESRGTPFHQHIDNIYMQPHINALNEEFLHRRYDRVCTHKTEATSTIFEGDGDAFSQYILDLEYIEWLGYA